MAQPTRSDDQVVRRRLSHNNLRRKQWRRRLPRAERKRPRRSGNSSALTFGVLDGAPHFFILHRTSCCSPDRVDAAGVSPRSEVADTPGRRARRQSAPDDAATTPQSTSEGRNPQWRRRLRAERRRRRRRGKFAARRERGRLGVPFFHGTACRSIAASSRPRSARVRITSHG